MKWLFWPNSGINPNKYYIVREFYWIVGEGSCPGKYALVGYEVYIGSDILTPGVLDTCDDGGGFVPPSYYELVDGPYDTQALAYAEFTMACSATGPTIDTAKWYVITEIFYDETDCSGDPTSIFHDYIDGFGISAWGCDGSGLCTMYRAVYDTEALARAALTDYGYA